MRRIRVLAMRWCVAGVGVASLGLVHLALSAPDHAPVAPIESVTELFAVVLDDVGMSDALRVETSPNGPTITPEFGSTKTEDGFKGLYAMSAYHHVKDGTAYPAVMFVTGINDPRVAPWQMAKMTARVQSGTKSGTKSGNPVLLRVDFDAGHGIGQQGSVRCDAGRPDGIRVVADRRSGFPAKVLERALHDV